MQESQLPERYRVTLLDNLNIALMINSLAGKQFFLLLRNLGRKGVAHLDLNPEAILAALEGIKICIIKQDTYTDLPSRNCYSYDDYLVNSNHRSGPYGLMKELNAHFRVVRTEPGCNIWQQKLIRGNQIHHNHIRKQQAQSSGSVHEIDFLAYDMVLSIECSVPVSITRAYPHVLWATMLEDHRLSEFRDFCKAPPVGYDLFIDQVFGPEFWFRQYRPHLLHFPYVIPHLKRSVIVGKTRRYAIVDSPVQDAKLRKYLESIGFEVRFAQSHSLSEYFDLLAETKYFISTNLQSPKWGNGFIEPAAFGCLNIGQANMYWNPCLLTPKATFSSSKDVISTISKFEENESLLKTVLETQFSLMVTYCVYQPFLKLTRWIINHGRKELSRSVKWEKVHRDLESM